MGVSAPSLHIESTASMIHVYIHVHVWCYPFAKFYGPKNLMGFTVTVVVCIRTNIMSSNFTHLDIFLLSGLALHFATQIFTWQIQP